MMIDTDLKVKTFNSTNADLLDEKVNKFLENYDNIYVVSITPFSSATSCGVPSRGLKICTFVGCQILYHDKPKTEQLDLFDEFEKKDKDDINSEPHTERSE